MANTERELVIGLAGQVYVAPVGARLPATATEALDSTFVDLGYTTEDGVRFTVTPEIQEFRVWQRKSAVRREVESREAEASFALAQWNADTVALAFGGGRVTRTGDGGFRYDPPTNEDALEERSLVIDIVDGDKALRIWIPRGNVSEAVEAGFQRGELAALPITFRALEPDTGAMWGFATGIGSGS